MDMQAQDRCHRIGQKHPVKVYRFATVNSVESHMLDTARRKLNLENLAIRKGNFTGLDSRSFLDQAPEQLHRVLLAEMQRAGLQERQLDDEFLFRWTELDQKAAAGSALNLMDLTAE